MKRSAFIIGFIWGVLFFTSCNEHKSLTITYFQQVNILNDSLRLLTDGIEYDSVRFSDGSYAVHRMGIAPMNTLTEFFDNKGRSIATIARASECYAQAWAYDYDEEGKLIHLVCFKHEMFDGLDRDSFYYERDSIGYLGFRQLIADLDYENPDTAKYEQINIDYDSHGSAVKTYKVYSQDRIEAKANEKLNISVRQCDGFWTDDLNGGCYEYWVTVAPRDLGEEKYKIKTFVNFTPYRQ